MGYSLVSQCLIWAGTLQDYVYGVRTSSNGGFDEPSGPFYYSNKGGNHDMDVSPDGRFVTIVGLGDPQLAVIGIQPDGSFYLVETKTYYFHSGNWEPYRVRYTPDGRFLIMLADKDPYLWCFAVDPATGALTEVDRVPGTVWVPGGYLVDALAVTPDSRFAVIPNENLNNGEYTFMVYRIADDGKLTLLTTARNDFPGYVSDMDFLPPYREPLLSATGWMFYE